jgi:hypothetical protein
MAFVLAWALASSGAAAQVISPDWTQDAAELAAAEPGLKALSSPIVSGNHVYRFTSTVVLANGMGFLAEYGFEGTDGPLTIVVLTLISGRAGALYDYLDSAYGPGDETQPLELLDESWVHTVEFEDPVSASRVLYDRKGKRCAVIYTPLE